MAKIQGYSEDDVDLLIADFERVVMDSITRTLTITANNLQGAIIADASSAGLNVDDIHIITQTWQDEVDGTLNPYIAEVYTGSATSVAIGLGESFPNDSLPGVPLIADDFSVSYMKTVDNRLVAVSDELWEDVRNELLDGIAQGQGVPQIRDRIMALNGFSEQRAATIARTEIHGAAEAGSIEQMRFVGYTDDDTTKEWAATIGDGRTRHTHILANKQKVRLNEKFNVGGALLDHPGDTTGPANEVIQCRCTQYFDTEAPPKFRCNSSLLAATAATSGACIVPIKPADISFLTDAMIEELFQMFISHKITPAWGGAKISKVLQEVRQTIAASPNGDIRALNATLSDRQILAAVDKRYEAKKDTFTTKYVSWSESPAGKKALGAVKPPIKAVKVPITLADEAAAPPPIPQLPPIAAKPQASDLVYTGKTLGSHGAQVWKNPATGERWLFKPQEKFLTDLDVAMARLQSKAAVTRPGVYQMYLDGKQGSIQYMFDSDEAFPHGSFSPLTLSAEDLAVLQREQIFDWMISNFDTHSGQYIRLADGTLYGTDKGQAFKFFGKDKLDWDYVPVTPLGQDKLTYPAMWKAFVQGKNIKLFDPTQGDIGAYMERLMAIPDDTYREILRPYAQKWYHGQGLEDFLDRAVKRKNDLKADFANFYARALAERAKHVPVPPTPSVPKVTPPPASKITPPAPSPTTGLSLDISSITPNTKLYITDKFKAAGGGKKVTPGWGGAKIYKVLQEMKELEETGALDGISDLQILRVLDEQGGFTGKPKTYESEVLSWLQTSAGKKWVASGHGDKGSTNVHPSLIPGKKEEIPEGPTQFNDAFATPPPAPQIEPIQPIKAVSKDAATEALETGATTSPYEIMTVGLAKYKTNDIIAYVKLPSGGTARVSKFAVGTVKMEVRELGDDEWYSNGLFTLAQLESHADDILAKTGYDLIWKTAELKTGGKSKVPGKVPGDQVTGDELWASHNLWDSGDIAAITIEDPDGITYRIVSDGVGGFRVESKFENGDWKTFISDINVNEFFNDFNAEFHLTPDTLTGAKPSLLFGKNVGDTAEWADIWSAPSDVPAGQTIAYAYDPAKKIQYRIMQDPINHLMRMDYRPDGVFAWNEWQTFDHKPSFVSMVSKYQWRVAKTNGDPPDTFIADIAGIKSPPSPIGVGAKVAKATPSAPPVPTEPKIKIGALLPKKGEKVSIHTMVQDKKTYPDNVVIAVGTSEKYAYPKPVITNWRIIKIDGKFYSQKQSTAGNWGSTKPVHGSYDVPSLKSANGGYKTWEISGEEIPPLQLKAVNKVIAKNTVEAEEKITVATKQAATAKANDYTQYDYTPPKVNLSDYNEQKRQQVISAYEEIYGAYYSKDPKTIWVGLQSAKALLRTKFPEEFDSLSDLQMLRIIDENNARKKGVPNAHLSEKAVVQWMQTPAAKKWLAKKIDAPVAAGDVPKARTDFGASKVPDEDQKYEQISLEQAIQYQAEAESKYGAWTPAERAALRKYTGGDFMSWNAAIRDGDISQYAMNIKNAQSGMRPSTRPMLLHRGAEFAEFNDPSIASYQTLLEHVGQTYITRGFTSTAVGGGTYGNKVQFEIEAPIGTPMAHVSLISKYQVERETTLPAHLIYKIISVKLRGSQTVIRVRVIGSV